MFFKYKHSILNRVMSGVLAILLVMLSVINPINMVPTYATGDRFGVTYHQNKDEAVDITIVSENDSFESEEEISLKLYIKNNSEEILYDGALSFTDSKDVFTSAEFVLSDETEVYIGEKGNLAGITLAPGEVLEAEFAGTIKDNAKLDGKRTLEFFFGAKDAAENTITRKVIFDYVTGFVTFLPVEFADGNEFAAGESGTMTFRISLDQSSHMFEDDSYTLATNSDADVMTDSDADVLTNSDAYLATDSDADEDRKKVSISEINFAIETTDMAFENVKLIDAKLIQTFNGSCEAEAIVSYTVGAENEVGTHYGNVKASVEIGKKTYKVYQGFEIEVTGFTAEELEAVQNVIDLIAKLPTIEEYLAAMEQFISEDGTEDEAGCEAYIRELTKLAVPAFEAYEALSDALKELIDPADVEKLEFIYGMCDPTTLEGENGEFNYIALPWKNDSGDTIATLKVYCVGLVNDKNIDLLVNAENTNGLVGTLTSNLKNTNNIYCSEIARKLGSEFGEILNAGLGDYELGAYLKSTLWQWGDNSHPSGWLDSINRVSYNDKGNADWHYTTMENDNDWPIVYGSNNNPVDELTIYFATTKPELLEVLPNDITLNATIQMFDYDAGTNGREGINEQGLGREDYHFYAWDDVSQIKDKYEYRFEIGDEEINVEDQYRSAPLGSLVPMAPTLDGPDGYPLTTIEDSDGNNYSLAYLFNNQAVGGKVIYPEMTDGGGLFQIDSDGYYVYDSAKNAAYYKYDPENDTNGFILYTDVLRPQHIAPTWDFTNKEVDKMTDDEKTIYGIRESNFLPFNEPWVNKSKDARHEHTYYTKTINKETGEYETKQVTATSYPLDWYYGTEGEKDTRTDYWFGMTLEFEFLMPKDGMINGNPMIFEFDGDDDVWVYIDDKLVLDIGACHEDRKGFINFANGKVSDPTTDGTLVKAGVLEKNVEKDLNSIFGLGTEKTFADYSVHKLKFFYMERGGSYSYCKIRFNLATLPDESLTVEKQLVDGNTENAEVKEYIADTMEYQFRVVDESGNPYIPATSSDASAPSGVKRTMYKLVEDGSVIDELPLNDDGSFYLKAGQSAQFTDMFQYDKDRDLSTVDTYFVQEIMPTNLTGQYNGMGFVINGAGGEVDYKKAVVADGKTSFKTDPILNNKTHYVLYKNKVDLSQLGILEIEKVQPEDSKLSLDQVFKVNVKIGYETLENLPEGTTYRVSGSDEPKTVGEDGCIELKIGETATLVEGILAGMRYEVSEDTTDAVKGYFKPTYSGTINNIASDNMNVGASGVNGSIEPGDKIHIVVSNADYDFKAELPVTKTTVDFQEGDPTEFTFVATPCNADGILLTETALKAVSTTVTVNNTAAKEYSVTGKFIFTFQNVLPEGKYYYLVSEVPGSEADILYDDSTYLVKITVAENNDGVKSATSTVVGKVSDGNIENATSIEFVNKKIIKLTVIKVIENYTEALKDTKFTFNIKVDDEDPISISLGHNEREIMDIPYGSNVMVREINHDGYLVTYVIGSDGNVVVGDSKSFESLVADTSITFTNRPGAVLPTTGGNGTLPYRMNGLLMMLMAAGYLLISEKKLRRKEEELSV